MKLIANALNGNYIEGTLLRNAPKDMPWVKAAIAYAAGNTKLFDFCIGNDIPLTFWGRYDYTVPVSIPLLKRFIEQKSPNFVCMLVQHFHSKIIWWGGYGVYIGSANLTQNGWYSNVETGTFLNQDEIVQNGIEDDLDNFFYELNKISHPLTEEVYNHLCEIEKNKKALNEEIENIKKKFKKGSKIPYEDPLIRASEKTSLQRRRDEFLREWNRTLQIMRDIADRVFDDSCRPSWIAGNVPKGVQADQFLHAHYYENVMDGNRSQHDMFFEKNKTNPEKALIKAMKWWKTLRGAPGDEDVMISDWAPYLLEKLSKEHILKMSKDEFIEVCSRIHAIRVHARQTSNEALGLPENTPSMTMDERAKIFGKWMFRKRSKTGKSPLEVINFVLYGGNGDDLPFRLWEAINEKKWYIPHLGISSLGELVGWALPKRFPPRNGRTSKALKSLGYDVRIHTA